jgi:putative transposase
VLERVIAREIAHWNAMPGPAHDALHQRPLVRRGVQRLLRAQVEIRKATDAQRRLWLLSTEPVRAHSRDGSITLDAGRVQGERMANRYWDSALIDHAGRQLVAKFDPQRLHEGVHVYTLDGRWICFAACDRPAGFNDQAAARERNRARNEFVRGAKLQAAAECA